MCIEKRSHALFDILIGVGVILKIQIQHNHENQQLILPKHPSANDMESKTFPWRLKGNFSPCCYILRYMRLIIRRRETQTNVRT